MKRIITSLLLIASMFASAQTITQNTGKGKTVTFDQSMTGPYKLVWKDKSRNGGIVSKTWSGKLENGRRVGQWSGTATYQNYEYGEGKFWQGTSTIVRNYVDGKPSGSYSVVDNVKYRNGRYNALRGVWEYEQWQEQSLSIKGSFKSGIAVGSWEIKSTSHKEHIIFQLTQEGTPDGDYNWNGSIRKFKSGYLIEETEMKEPTWGIKLSYTPEEIEAFTPEQADREPFIISNYGEFYLTGARWEDEIRNYPLNSSDDPTTTGEYMVVDRKAHEKLIGNAPEWYLQMNGLDEASIKERTEKEAAQAYYDKYITGYEASKRKAYDILFSEFKNIINYWKPILEKDPIDKEVYNKNDKLSMICSYVNNQDKHELFYKEQLDKKIQELKHAQYELPSNDVEEHVLSLLEQHTPGWQEFLKQCYIDYVDKKVENMNVVDRKDVLAYMITQKIVYVDMFNKVSFTKEEISKDEVLKFKRDRYRYSLMKREPGEFSHGEYYESQYDACFNDKKFMKYFEKQMAK